MRAIQQAMMFITLDWVCFFMVLIQWTAGGEFETSEAPKFVRVPENITVLRGEDATFACEAEGVPEPSITWVHQREEGGPHGPVRFKSVNGVLTIPGSPLFMSGLYTCEAWNIAGTKQATASLTVYVGAGAHVYPPNEEVEVGEPVSFTCHGLGHPPPEIQWYQQSNQTLLPLDGNARINVTDTELPGEKILSITHAQKQDSGVYVCEATNALGTDSVKATLRVKDAFIPVQSVEMKYRVGYVNVMLVGRKEVVTNLPIRHFRQDGNPQNYWKYTVQTNNPVNPDYTEIEASFRGNTVYFTVFRAELSDLMRVDGWTLRSSSRDSGYVYDIWEKSNKE